VSCYASLRHGVNSLIGFNPKDKVHKMNQVKTINGYIKKTLENQAAKQQDCLKDVETRRWLNIESPHEN
jgi:N-acetylneuraminic acid mutarotase